MTEPGEPPRLPVEDEGLRCPHCDYNLTGLPGSICPECGNGIDWRKLRYLDRLVLEQVLPLRATFWDRWDGLLKIPGFVLTILEVAFAPWQFAARLPAHPRASWAVAFLAVCYLVASLGMTNAGHALGWMLGATFHVLLQTAAFGLLLPPRGVRAPHKFWLVVSCYTSYPVLFQALVKGVPWPLGTPLARPEDILATLLYYLWWLDLAAIIITLRGSLSLRRVLAAILLIPFISVFVGTLVVGC